MINEEQVRDITKKVLDEEHLTGFIKIFEKEHNLFRGSHDKIGLPETIVIPEKIITQIIQAGSLEELEDVSIPSHLTGDFIQYDGEIEKWKRIPALNQGSIIFPDEKGYFTEDPANFFWDNINKRLGIGTSTPDCEVDIEFEADETVLLRISAKTRPWQHWECVDGDWGYAFGIHADDKMFHIHYDSPIGSEVKGFIHLDGTYNRVGILEDNPSCPFDVGGNTRIQGNLEVTGTINLGTLTTLAVLTLTIPYIESPDGVLHVKETDFLDTPLFERTGGVTDASRSAIRLLATKSTDMGDGFGSGVMFCIKDNADVINLVASIAGVRDGADNSGAITFKTHILGSDTEKIRIDKDGNFWIENQQELRFYDNGNYVGFEAPALEADQVWVLPTADGDLNDALITNGEGVLSWTAVGAGASTFLALTDTPANYTGSENKIVKVNATPDALEFGADISDLEDVDSISGKAGKYAKVKVADAGIEWVAVAGDGGEQGPVLIFDSGFDDLALGNINGKGVYSLWGSWVNSSGADCTAEIVADPGNGRMLRLSDQSAVNECHASLTMTPALSAEVLMGIVEWKVKINQFAAGSRGYFNIQDKDIGATEQGGYFRGDSTDIYYRSSSGTTAHLVNAVVDTWYIVRTFFNRLGNYSVWWVDGAFEQGPVVTTTGNKFDKLVLSTRDIHSGNVFDIKYIKVWSLHYV